MGPDRVGQGGVRPRVPDQQSEYTIDWVLNGIMSGHPGRKLVAKFQLSLEQIGEGEEARLAHRRTDELHSDRKACTGASAWN